MRGFFFGGGGVTKISFSSGIGGANMYIWDKASKTCLIVSRQNQFPSRDPGRDRQVAPCYEGGGSQPPQWVGLRGYGHLTRGGQGHNLGALRTDSGDVFCSHWRHHTATKFFETFAKLLSFCFLTVIRRETFTTTSQVGLTVTFMKHKIEKRLLCNVKKKVVIVMNAFNSS